MSGDISFRHNVIAIRSLESFAGIRGGFNGTRKDVCFVRCLGESANFAQAVQNIDRMLGEAMASNRLMYIRLSELPKIADRGDIDYYVKAYTDWKGGSPLKLRSGSADADFIRVLENATKNTILQYKTAQKNANETTVRNFVIKLWFRTDTVLKEVTQKWSAYNCVKLVADNVTKPQDYLFYYYATLIGCDVLLLNNREDLKAGDSLLNLSGKFVLGSFGNTVIPKYVKPAPKAAKPDRKERGTAPVRGHAEPVPVSRPIRKEQRPAAGTSQSAGHKEQRPAAGASQAAVRKEQRPAAEISQTAVRKEQRPAAETSQTAVRKEQRPAVKVPRRESGTGARKTSARSEKSFEELADLASSIVMITVFDRNGEPHASGSGIMVGTKGFILTNFHVVKGGVIYAVQIEDDEKVYVTDEIIKYNPQLDLAVIRIDRKLVPLPVYDGRKKLARGQKVVAIGSPLGLFNSVSDGIISGFRKIKDVEFIQFTAPISHGSSGGAVLNMYGEIIGISTAGIDSGQNINLAVDYRDIRMFAKGFIDG